MCRVISSHTGSAFVSTWMQLSCRASLTQVSSHKLTVNVHHSVPIRIRPLGLIEFCMYMHGTCRSVVIRLQDCSHINVQIVQCILYVSYLPTLCTSSHTVSYILPVCWLPHCQLTPFSCLVLSLSCRVGIYLTDLTFLESISSRASPSHAAQVSTCVHVHVHVL